ncbi:MAG TPA: 4'-phosphopantetheinyl transferase superfamily protein [Ornithinibacter sp.]|nr:4'-phosphopantetheinyl transferase superfamily protein [Ornithinibacter sp.]
MGRVRAVRRNASWRIGFAATEALAGDEALHPDEVALVAGASPGRRAEFATGRQCARLALTSLGRGPAAVPVLRDDRGAPLWPAGVVGSITHCAGWTGAVVARSGRSRWGEGVSAIGLDAEPVGPLPDGVLDVVASGEERAALAGLAVGPPGIPWDTVLFAAKEATYKAWYPLTGIVLGHAAVGVELSRSGTFTGVAAAHDLRGRQVVHRVRGRWGLGPRVLVAMGVVG